jgi:hypothetical protein
MCVQFYSLILLHFLCRYLRGYTRSRRYANHPSGKKYDTKSSTKNGSAKLPDPNWSKKNKKHYQKSKAQSVLPQADDALTSEKAQCAKVFQVYLKKIRNDADYLEAKKKHQDLYS